MKNRRRYCIFAAQYLPHMGGVERYTYNLAKKLTERGNEVTIVTSNVYFLPDYENIEGIRIYRVPSINLLDGRYPTLKINRKFLKINRMLSHRRYDIVIVNTRFYIHSLYGMIFAWRNSIPCITVEHGTSHLSVHNRMLDYAGALYEHILTRFGYMFCKDFYGVSEACNEWLGHFHIKAKGVLYNSIDIDAIRKIEKKPMYRMEYNIADNAIVIVFTGRLLAEKGLRELLNVMDRLHQIRKDIYLFIAGDGELKDEIIKRRTDYIIPLGRIDFEDIVVLLRECDVFCLPSVSEGFSTAILEAAACRCYILTTERGGAKELLISEEYGSVIPSNKEEVLFSELKEVLDDQERRKKAVELTYRRLHNYFTWDTMVDQVEKICEKLSRDNYEGR